ncbi:sulfite exporter TauE/SafE family protein [Frigidibacter sp. ROC022]|uniref:sulfite exporter TauE/SafE family protein n=1 Tax=Frigidibacter sp. ROC022 TaxID=2971796 RepID=UPI00215AB68D|nr:sulfite exporter TauE/SafE family protein [Frigidibacter sp. ROC022]MCR8724302.1 sulfite exporter TauE/SafE family protein [Frigidibacter sp. ROC022]
MFGLDPTLLAATLALTMFGGFVKGAVGFGQPMIMISGFATILPPDVALAALIVPMVTSNAWQGLRGGFRAAWASVLRFRLYLAIVMVFIAGAAQLVRILPNWMMLLILGVPITLFSLSQLAGWGFRIAPERRRLAEVLIGSFAGFVGGMSGVWGPPTVLYLTAIDTPKVEQIRVQGVIYGLGAVVLLLAHLKSGVLNAETAPLSMALVVPGAIGMALGFAVQDRLDQRRFRQATLAVLVVVGLNLIRRGLAG